MCRIYEVKRELSIHRYRSQKGFALVAALMACMILMALAVLVIYVSTQDLRTSSRTVGEKKAFSAAESGIQRLMSEFDPFDPLTEAERTNQQVDPATDPHSRYTIGTIAAPSSGASFLPLRGYAIMGGQVWGQRVYITSVTGLNETYGTTEQISLSFSFGPVEQTTQYR